MQNVDVYMFPCRGKSASSQASGLVRGLGNADYGMIWIDVEANPSSGCSWASYSASSNCDYIVELINALRAEGATVGVYSSEYEWGLVTGSRTSCTKVAATGV